MNLTHWLTLRYRFLPFGQGILRFCFPFDFDSWCVILGRLFFFASFSPLTPVLHAYSVYLFFFSLSSLFFQISLTCISFWLVSCPSPQFTVVSNGKWTHQECYLPLEKFGNLSDDFTAEILKLCNTSKERVKTGGKILCDCCRGPKFYDPIALLFL